MASRSHGAEPVAGKSRGDASERIIEVLDWRRTNMHLLFVYGTLAPETPDVARLEGWASDAVRGRLYDLGPYPALVDTDDAEAGWVEGYVRSVTSDQLSGSLDSYEGVDEGLYRRITTTTRAGRQVWVYIYARTLPSSAIGPLPQWNSSKRVRLFSPPGNQQGVV